MPGTVTVACKLPHGLVLQEQTMVKRSEPVMGGGYREYEIAVRTGRAITVAGSARPVNPSEEVEFAPHAGGYGLTPGVDISVTGYDDLEEASIATPALTTVWNGQRDVGRDAARALLDRIEGKKSLEGTLHLVRPELHVRQSTTHPVET